MFDLRFSLGGGEFGGGYRIVGEHGSFDFLQDCFVLVRGVVFERIKAEVDGVIDLFLTELAGYIRCSLDD